jgi:hypothetical protein
MFDIRLDLKVGSEGSAEAVGDIRSDLVKPVRAQLGEEMHRERTLGWVRRG